MWTAYSDDKKENVMEMEVKTKRLVNENDRDQREGQHDRPEVQQTSGSG